VRNILTEQKKESTEILLVHSYVSLFVFVAVKRINISEDKE
jgi:hypothetical protein